MWALPHWDQSEGTVTRRHTQGQPREKMAVHPPRTEVSGETSPAHAWAFWPPELSDSSCLLVEPPAVAFAVVPKLTDGASVRGGDHKGLSRLEGRFWKSGIQAWEGWELGAGQQTWTRGGA